MVNTKVKEFLKKDWLQEATKRKKDVIIYGGSGNIFSEFKIKIECPYTDYHLKFQVTETDTETHEENIHKINYLFNDNESYLLNIFFFIIYHFDYSLDFDSSNSRIIMDKMVLANGISADFGYDWKDTSDVKAIKAGILAGINCLNRKFLKPWTSW